MVIELIGLALVVIGILLAVRKPAPVDKQSATGTIKIIGFTFETSNVGLVLVVLGCVMALVPLLLSKVGGQAPGGCVPVVRIEPGIVADGGVVAAADGQAAPSGSAAPLDTPPQQADHTPGSLRSLVPHPPRATARATGLGPHVTPAGVVFNFKPPPGAAAVYLSGNFNR